jgi:hypothetical protein
MVEAILTLSQALDRSKAEEPIAPTVPKHLKRWERPRDYFGAEWSSYYSADGLIQKDFLCANVMNEMESGNDRGRREGVDSWTDA